jgi:hypothetical protein
MISDDEYVDMLIVFGECNQNVSKVQHTYQQRYPERKLPSVTVFFKVERQLQHTGVFKR